MVVDGVGDVGGGCGCGCSDLQELLFNPDLRTTPQRNSKTIASTSPTLRSPGRLFLGLEVNIVILVLILIMISIKIVIFDVKVFCYDIL